MKYFQSRLALVIATILFALNFSAWMLYAVLAMPLSDKLNLSTIEFSVLLSSPMLAGVFFCLLAGFFSQWYNPKKAWSLQMLLVIPVFILLPFAETFIHYLILGCWLGLSGMSFTFGMAYISAWFGKTQQGTMMGLLGVGHIGAAVTLVFVPFVLDKATSLNVGITLICVSYALSLLGAILVLLLFAPKMPLHWQTKARGVTQTQWSLLKDIRIWRFGLYYFFVFGAFIALLLWLPQYYLQIYQLTLKQAMAFTLFFVVVSSVVQAMGGWFADRYGARTINIQVFWVCLICLFFLSYPPTTMTIHGLHADVDMNINIGLWFFTLLLLVMALAQGFGRASVYKLISDYYPDDIEVISGFVSSIGILGGFILPIVFGIADNLIGIHTACFMLLYGILALCMIVNHFAIRTERYQRRLSNAMDYNFLEDDSFISELTTNRDRQRKGQLAKMNKLLLMRGVKNESVT